MKSLIKTLNDFDLSSSKVQMIPPAKKGWQGRLYVWKNAPGSLKKVVNKSC